MCNSYRIQPKRSELTGLRGKVSAAAETLASPLVRKSDPGMVVLADERVCVMRWGFHRPFNPSINNTRSDKLDSPIWREAFRDRRCVIPMSWFYEWGPGPGGRKQAYEFHSPSDDFLWAAGIWEDHPDFGPCYSMITTAASSVMAPIHNRMPGLLLPDQIPSFLDGCELSSLKPERFHLATPRPCPSPLAKPKPPDPQQELF